MMPSHELAWAAGFFDGEGSTCCFASPKQRSLSIGVAQVNRNNLLRFQAAIGGIGTVGVNLPPSSKLAKRPIAKFQAYNDKALAGLRLFWPFLGEEKQGQAARALIKWWFRSTTTQGFPGFCVRGHSNSEFGLYERRRFNRKQGGELNRECVECRRLRHLGPLPQVPRRTAIELGLGVRQYVPPPLVSSTPLEAVAWAADMTPSEYARIAVHA